MGSLQQAIAERNTGLDESLDMMERENAIMCAALDKIQKFKQYPSLAKSVQVLSEDVALLKSKRNEARDADKVIMV
jgi:hypothetical protein